MEESKEGSPDDVFEQKLAALRNIFPNIRDGNLVKFLQFKHNVNRAIACIKSHTAFRTENPWIDKPILRAGSDVKLKKILESGVFVCPDGMVDKLGRPCLFVCPRKNDMSDGRTVHDICRAALYSLERQLNRSEVLEKGMVAIHDLRGLGQSNFNSGISKVLFSAFSGKMPIRMKAFYFIDAPWFFKALFSITSVCMSTKLKERVVFLHNFEDLLKYIDADKLPEEYGGHIKHNQKDWIANQIAEENSMDLCLLEELILH